MTEVKSLKVTDSTYRHRGWMWRDRATYESFKSHMKLPLWVDRILMNANDSQRFVVGSKDGERNAAYIGDTRLSRWVIPTVAPSNMVFNCNTNPRNEFVVLAERIRAKKPDANKPPRPQWRRTMTKPWEPHTLSGEWILDSKLVKEIRLNVVVPERADRLYISTSGGTDTLVWVDSTTLKPTLHRSGGKAAWAQGVVGIKGRQSATDYDYDTVLLHDDCHWQLAGVRKKTVQVPLGMVVQTPVVVKPEPDVPVTATAVRAAQEEQASCGTDTGRVPHLSPLLASPYGTVGQDMYQRLASTLGISRGAAKVRLFRDLYAPQPRGKTIIFDYENVERMLLAYCTADALSTVPKPPIGVKPRNLHDEERANALDEAMVRYLNADLPFPIEWATEWNELRARLNKEQK